MIRLWKFLHERKALETEAEKVFREKFEDFLTILTENEHSLYLMAELENKYFNDQLISIPYLRNMIKNLSKSIRSVVDNLVLLSNGRYSNVVDIFEALEGEIRGIITGRKAPVYTPITIPMGEIGKEFIDKVGSKIANLGELRRCCNLLVPDGFAITACAFTDFLEFNNLSPKIAAALTNLDIKDSQMLIKVEREIKKMILESLLPPEIEYFVRKECEKLEQKHSRALHWAVRSSAIGEDMENSFAGQFSTILNVRSDELLEKYKEVLASKYNAHAIVYQRIKHIRDEDVNMSVGFMEMVDPLCSGVLYTTDPVNPNNGRIIINAVWGLGQLLVEGVISADVFVLRKDKGFLLERKEIAQKEVCLIQESEGGVRHRVLSDEDCTRPCLGENQLKELAEMALKVEAHFNYPQDIEWCFDRQGSLYLLQARPLPVFENSRRQTLTESINAPIIAKNAQVAGIGRGWGKVFKVSDIHELTNFPEGGVLVTQNSSPRFTGALQRAAAVVVENGNATDHMTSVVRELKVPCVVKVPSIFSILQNGQEITVDATQGIIYRGKVTELLAEAAVLRNKVVNIRDTESHRLLKKMAPFIFPLHLTDPRSDNFSAASCRTWHDILRFSHESALNEMFSLKEKSQIGKVKNIFRIKTNLPFMLYVLDIFGNTVVESRKKEIEPEAVSSLPFQELWKGMNTPSVPWSGPAQQMGLKDFFSAMSRTSEFDRRPMDTRSYAVIAPDYLNLSLSMGYHYVVLDSYLSDDPFNNYISLSFKGGAAEANKRRLRVIFVSKILKRLGFDVSTTHDFLTARVKSESDAVLAEKINIIGRMLGVTRLLDLALNSEEMVDGCVEKFFMNDYSLGIT